MINLEFDPLLHQYTINGDPAVSVTRLIHSYCHPFEADEHAERIGSRDGKTAEQVKKEWNDAGELAADRGTDIHAAADDLIRQAITGEINTIAYMSGPMAALMKFIEDHGELIGSTDVWPEQRLCHSEYRVAGTTDLICNLDGLRTVLDWKAIKNIEVLGYGNKVMYSPCNHLLDTNYNHYALQLNCYRVMLIDYYDYTPEQLVLIHLGSNGKYERYNMPVWEDLARKIMSKGERPRKK